MNKVNKPKGVCQAPEWFASAQITGENVNVGSFISTFIFSGRYTLTLKFSIGSERKMFSFSLQISDFHNLGAFLVHYRHTMTDVFSLNLVCRWSGVSGLCHNLWLLDELRKDCKRRTGWTFCSIQFWQAGKFFCRGSSIFLTLRWWRKYIINVPLLCSGATSLQASTKITWIWLLPCSVSQRDVTGPSGVCFQYHAS